MPERVLSRRVSRRELRWPEPGFELAPGSGPGSEDLRLTDWVPWRGARSERSWPEQFRQGVTWPGRRSTARATAPVPAITLTGELVAALSPDELACSARRLTSEVVRPADLRFFPGQRRQPFSTFRDVE